MLTNVSILTVLLALILVRHSSQELCRDSEGCNCFATPPDEYELNCPKNTDSMFIIEVRSRTYAALKCNMKPSWVDFKYQSKASELQEVDFFKFEKCSLPGVPLHAITRRIGIQPVKVLRFESYQNLSSTMERRYLSGFPKVNHLSLNSNGLTEVSEDLFADLPELVLLELRENNLVLPARVFNGLSKLKKLELGNNKMTQLEPSLLNNLTRLEHLGLWGNLLTDLDPHIFDGSTALNTINLRNNRLTALPSEIFRSLSNLKSLYIDGNNFSSLPDDLFSHNGNLNIIQITHNNGNLTTLPSGFLSNLTKLGEVVLSRNKLETLPENLFWGSTNLTTLDLRGNLLATLPKRIFKDLVNLKTLDLSSNKLTNLPDAVFAMLTKLDNLKLQKNNLTFISEKMFSGLSGLKELNLQENGLRNIDSNSFHPLIGLRIARLSHNEITLGNGSPITGNSPFDNCKDLEELDLAHNSITKIFYDWRFIPMKLHKLDLKYNKIPYISTLDLHFMPRNIIIDLSYNNITEINLTAAESLARIQEFTEKRDVQIKVEGNPLICDCRIFDLLKYLDGEMHPAVQELFHIIPGDSMCGGLESGDMVGTQISDLKYKYFKCSQGQCPEKCACSKRQYDDTFFVDCSYKNLSVAPERIVVDKNLKVELNLTGNFLKEVPSFNQSGFGNITALLLSHNIISNVSFENIPPMLEVLELHKNNLIKMDSAFLERMKKSITLKNLTLHDNPWNCDCETRDFLGFIQMKFEKIPEVSKVTCADDKQPLFEMTADKLCSVPVGKIIAGSMSVALLGLLVGILAALYYRYQSEIKVWLFAHQLCLWFVTEEELDKDKQYDAFISYSHKDEEFVVNELIPKLEEGPRPFKLCVHYRDWMAGEWIPTQIVKSVEDSKRTIVILSPNFLKSEWGRMEFRAAHSQALSEGRARVIVILLGDVGPTENLDAELKAYLSMNTYVEWGDPWFWDKLRYALPHPPQVAKNAARKIFETHQHHIRIDGGKNGLIHLPGVPVTPPANTTPPADSLKTFIDNGNLNEGVLITDCLKNENKFDNFVPNKIANDNMINNR